MAYVGVPSSSSKMSIFAAGQLQLRPEEQELFEVFVASIAFKGRTTVARVAGGWVRDKLLGRPSDDIDIALDDQSGEDFANGVNDFLRHTGRETHTVAVIQANPDQSKHLHTATLRVMGLDVDCVNLRAETYTTDSRIPQIRCGSAEEDAFRRDFTINALFYNLETAQVEDLTGKGLSDLSFGLLRTPLPPLTTFLDDPLRVLRAIRFSCRLVFRLDSELLAAAREPTIKSALLHKVSRDRILKECDGMLCGLHDSISGSCSVRLDASVEGVRGKSCRPALALLLIHRLGLFDSVFMVPPEAPLLLGDPCRVDEQATRCVLDNWEQLSAATVAWANVLLSLSSQQPVHSSVGSMLVSQEAWSAQRGGRGDERYVFFASAVIGLRGLYTFEKKKIVPLHGHMLRESLRIDSETARSVHVLLDAIGAATAMAEHPPEQPPSRVDMGMFVRSCKGLWRAALLVACAERLAQSHDSSIMTQAEVEADIVIPLTACTLLSKYTALEAVICSEGLDEAWLSRPLLDGNELSAAVGVPRGPALGRLLDEAVRWQLRYPSGSKEQLVAHLRSLQM